MDAFEILHGSCILTVLLVNLIHVTQSIPPDYCFHKLNTSDCHGPPTEVAYYYEPGSRCDVAIWRGCPTKNKFHDEVICSHTCIARFRWGSEEMEMGEQPEKSEGKFSSYFYSGLS
ncbi:hypothetical protein ABMA27_013768 [Loxostege sticticalis]|uniref:BPTI/Kunitz inhibitor domain-containing protein n=1 Tax=Loxostege sticticalis TaxID=481309 RepID=A0ABR3IBH5_LOXSC